ncbi:MAG: hypothetical protein ACK4WF_07580 [Candidatus Brocadiales bacterium]
MDDRPSSKCKNCGQVSKISLIDPPSIGEGWDVLGKNDGRLVIQCLRCGHGLRLGILFTDHLVKEFCDDMRKALDEYLKREEML